MKLDRDLLQDFPNPITLCASCVKLCSYFTTSQLHDQYSDYFLLQLNATHCITRSLRCSTVVNTVQKWKFEDCSSTLQRCSGVRTKLNSHSWAVHIRQGHMHIIAHISMSNFEFWHLYSYFIMEFQIFGYWFDI